MSSTANGNTHSPTEHLEAAEKALNAITDNAHPEAREDPGIDIHTNARHENTHVWLRSLFPYNSLEEMEQAWHLGNYVLDRKTGKKSFEEMSIYVRVQLNSCTRPILRLMLAS